MTEPDQAVIARLSSDLAAIAAYAARASADVQQLRHLAAQRPVPPPWPQPHPAPPPPPPVQPEPQRPPAEPRTDGWIGKALAAAGVAVTLVGVALLLVLAAQAGILRPEFRVVAGAALAASLVGVAWRVKARPGGRVGAIALAATGIAAAYIDVIAVTAIYGWVSGPAGLVIAAGVAVTGLMLARRWDSEHLALLVLVPLIGLAPVVADGVTVLLVGFMLALAAASVPIQLGKDWIGLHAARTAVGTLPLLAALPVSFFSSSRSPALAVACGLAAALAVGSALVLQRHTTNMVAMGLLSAVGTLPVLAASLAVSRTGAAWMSAGLGALLLVIVLAGARWNVVDPSLRTIWAALAAVSALIAVTVAFDGPVAGPTLLAMAVVVAIAGRRSRVAPWCALAFGAVGGLFYLAHAPLGSLLTPTPVSTPTAVSTLVASLLLVAGAVTLAWSWRDDWSTAAAVVVAWYGITVFAVTSGVLFGSGEQGFFAGHVAATIGWIAMAAAMFRHATRVRRERRSLPIAGGLALVAAAMGKLFLFDLGTLDGIFRVVVFIVVGVLLLGMGAGYARVLAQQDGAN